MVGDYADCIVYNYGFCRGSQELDMNKITPVKNKYFFVYRDYILGLRYDDVLDDTDLTHKEFMSIKKTLKELFDKSEPYYHIRTVYTCNFYYPKARRFNNIVNYVCKLLGERYRVSPMEVREKYKTLDIQGDVKTDKMIWKILTKQARRKM